MGRGVLTSVSVIAALLMVVACAEVENDTHDAQEAGALDETPAPVATPTPEPTPTIVHPPIATDYDDAVTDDLPSPEDDDPNVIDWHESTPTFADVDQGPDGEYYLIYQRSLLLILTPDGQPVELIHHDELDDALTLTVDSQGIITVAAGPRVHRIDRGGDYLGFLRTDEFLRGEHVRAYNLAAGPDDYVYVSHANEEHLTVFSPDGETFEEIPEARISGGGAGSSIDFDADGRMYLLAADPQHGTFIQVRDRSGETIHEWDLEGYEGADENVVRFSTLMAVAPDGTVATLTPIPDDESVEPGSGLPPGTSDYVVQVYAAHGDLQDTWRAVEDTELDDPLWLPTRFTINADGHLIVPDGGPGSHRIQRFSVDGEFLGEWGGSTPDVLCDSTFEFPELDCE